MPEPLSSSEQSAIDLIAACLALPIVERRIKDIRGEHYAGFSSLSPRESRRMRASLAPWETRQIELLATIQGNSK